MSVTERKNREIWLIEPDELVLYRVISDVREQVIPIKGNRAVRKFMCVPNKQIDEILEELTSHE